VCATDLAVSAVVASAPVPQGWGAAVAACPEGSVAIGGGAALGNLGVRLTELAPRFEHGEILAVTPEGENPAPVAWSAFAVNPVDSSPTLKVAVLCAEHANVSARVRRRTMLVSAGSDEGCAEGTTAVGGGIASLDPLGLTLTASAPWWEPEAPLSLQPDGTHSAPAG